MDDRAREAYIREQAEAEAEAAIRSAREVIRSFVRAGYSVREAIRRAREAVLAKAVEAGSDGMEEGVRSILPDVYDAAGGCEVLTEAIVARMKED